MKEYLERIQAEIGGDPGSRHSFALALSQALVELLTLDSPEKKCTGHYEEGGSYPEVYEHCEYCNDNSDPKIKPEDKKCKCTDPRGHGAECTKFKPEIHAGMGGGQGYEIRIIELNDEPSFIDRKVSEFREKWLPSQLSYEYWTPDGMRIQVLDVSREMEEFLRTALEEARNESIRSQVYGGATGCSPENQSWFNRGKETGRLAMKEEIQIEAVKMLYIKPLTDEEVFFNIKLRQFLAAIRNKK